MTNNRDYAREYARSRRARIYEMHLDPETHPLRIWRKQYGLSMAKTGRLLGVTNTTIWNWEYRIDPTPEWVLDLVSEGMTEYTERKLRESEARYQEQLRLNPIRAWRAARGMSQPELASFLGVTQGKLSAWETGNRPTPEWVTKRLEEL